MATFDLSYLKHLIKETNNKRKDFHFFIPDEEGAEISYMPSKLKLYWAGLIDSLHFRHEMEKYSIRERKTLRRNTQHYHRIVRKNGLILRIDSFVEGKPDTVNIIHYEGNRRYTFPFSPEGGFYPTYTDVVTFENGFVTEDYMVSNNQIVHRAYTIEHDNKIKFQEINYVPNGTYPIIGIKIGEFTNGDKLSYQVNYQWAWYTGTDIDKSIIIL